MSLQSLLMLDLLNNSDNINKVAPEINNSTGNIFLKVCQFSLYMLETISFYIRKLNIFMPET